jgi:hypothetical protein
VIVRSDPAAEERAGRLALIHVVAQAARAAWEAGDLERAAAFTRTCSELDPDRAAPWQRRQEEIAAASSPLAVQYAVRLAAAGIQHDDPGLHQIREWNAAVRARTAQPEPEAGS